MNIFHHICIGTVPVAMYILLRFAPVGTPFVMLVLLLGVSYYFFRSFEKNSYTLRNIMPCVIMASVAAVGRILFAPIPDVKPTSAIVIVAGSALGAESGFVCGALAALVSNFFFGQGFWTPWQMYAWGLVGYLAGVFSYYGFFDKGGKGYRKLKLMIFGFVSAFVFGFIMNMADIVNFIRPFTLEAVITRVIAAIPFDLVHAFATCAFILPIYEPWHKKISRIIRKYNILGYE